MIINERDRFNLATEAMKIILLREARHSHYIKYCAKDLAEKAFIVADAMIAASTNNNNVYDKD